MPKVIDRKPAKKISDTVIEVERKETLENVITRRYTLEDLAERKRFIEKSIASSQQTKADRMQAFDDRIAEQTAELAIVNELITEATALGVKESKPKKK